MKRSESLGSPKLEIKRAPASGKSGEAIYFGTELSARQGLPQWGAFVPKLAARRHVGNMSLWPPQAGGGWALFFAVIFHPALKTRD